VQATFAATLLDEWCQRGLCDVVISPGSRSTPLALACAARAELTLHVRIDERSAGFFALGRALATRRPVAIVVTSGTAAAELHAVVAEADLANVPLLVLTADRPPELHGVGAPQTIEQGHLYAAMVRRFEDPGVASAEAAPTWRPLATRLWNDALGASGSRGPVHLNAAFAEPLVAEPLALPPRDITDLVSEPVQSEVAELDVNARRVLAVVGPGVDAETVSHCVALDWVVLGDATSQGTVSYFDPLLRDERFAAAVVPELVVRIGGLVASKVLQDQLDRWSVRTVALSGAGFVADPGRLIDETVEGLPRRDVAGLRGDPAYVAIWHDASARVGEWLDSNEADGDALDEPMLARAVVRASGDHRVPLVIGSSMPFRDVEWWAPPRRSITYSNRGANGIDGVVSTVLGVCAGARGLGLVGDLTMLHDVSGLVDGLGAAAGTCVLVVADNNGGGIFSFLPQATVLAAPRFEQLFGTPRALDLAGIAAAFGHASTTVATRSQLREAIDAGLEREGVTVVVARVPSREENVRRHQLLNEAVQRCWNPDRE
jgi:2-succinyl-5-enolpyruvyl-6-hydroxy-3-cyclohexene-1-carboxylate synthase